MASVKLTPALNSACVLIGRSALEPVVSSVVIHVKLRLYFEFSVFISLYGRQKKSEAFWTDQQVSRDFLFFLTTTVKGKLGVKS